VQGTVRGDGNIVAAAATIEQRGASAGICNVDKEVGESGKEMRNLWS
jgi:hypothetical protein